MEKTSCIFFKYCYFHRTLSKYSLNFFHRNFSSSRESRFLGKMLSPKKSERRKHFVEGGKLEADVQKFINEPSAKRKLPMRVSVLNKLFMTYVTDILSTGTLSVDLVGKGLEITKVSVSKDYSNLNVFWVAKNSEEESFLANMLPRVCSRLRHELTMLYLVGNMPNVNFIRDHSHQKFTNLDKLITTADKGSTSDHEKCAPVDNTEEIPPMPMNVYGLQYDKILFKIQSALSKNKVRKPVTPRDSNLHQPVDMNLISIYNEKEAIRKFLLHKKLEKQKFKKDSKYPLDLQDSLDS